MPRFNPTRFRRSFPRWLAAVAVFTAAASAVATPLFRDLVYDTPIKDFDQAKGYYDCSADMGYTARCVDGVTFLGHKFDLQVLAFVNGRLRSVQLVTDFKAEIYASLIKALMDGFSLIVLQSGDRRMDLIETARKEGESRLWPKVSEFESVALNKGDLVYMFIEQPRSALRAFSTGFEAILKSPPTTREADVLVKEKDKEAIVSVVFSLPRRVMQDLQSTPAPKEKF